MESLPVLARKETFDNESDLVARLKTDVLRTFRPNILLLGGHAPLNYNEEGAFLDTNAWGAFTPYSLELACNVGDYAREIGRNVQFMILADDINFEDFKDNTKFSRQQKRRKRNKFYKDMSGENAVLPQVYADILRKYGFSEKDITRQDQDKIGRDNSLVTSERILRIGRDGKTECSKAYRGVVDVPSFEKVNQYVITFVPDQCTGNICGGVLDNTDLELATSTVTMKTDGVFLEITDKNAIWSKWEGVDYRRDSYCD